MAFKMHSFINHIFSGKTTGAITARRLDNHAEPQETALESSREIIVPPKHQLSGLEIEFLSMLEGKKANDASVLGWWCAFHNLDREKLIKKLKGQGYIAFADYRLWRFRELGSSAHLVNQRGHFADRVFGGKRRAALAISG